MSDNGDIDSISDSPGSGTSWRKVAAVVAVIAVVIVVAVVLLNGGGDEEDDGATGASTAEADAPGTSDEPEPSIDQTLELVFSIDGIEDGGEIPAEFTCDGADTAPIITVDSIGQEVVELAVIVEDASSDTEYPFAQWLVYNIPADVSEIVDQDGDLTFGLNDAGVLGWTGPCPPEGDDAHNYVFSVYGFDEELNLNAGLSSEELFEAIEVKILSSGNLQASYQRAS